MAQKRSRRPWGSITEMQRGKKYVVRWVENTDAGRKRRSRTIYGTAAEASRFLAIKEVERGLEHRAPTVSEAVEAWYLPWLTQRLETGAVKPASARLYTNVWNRLGEPRWGKVPIDRIKPAEWQEWLLQQNKSNARYCTIVLRKTLDIAVRNDAITENVLRREYDMPVRQEQRKVRDVYDLAQAERVLDMVMGTPAEAPFILMCFGGLRVGESLAVRCDEVRSETVGGVMFAVVPVRRRLNHRGRAPMPDGDLKTAQSLREAIVPGPYAARLLELRDVQPFEWLAAMPDGWPPTQHTLRYQFARTLGTEAIPLSNLRASWRTIGEFEWRVPSDTLEVLMGHALPGVSGRHYVRPKTTDLMRSFAEAYCKHV